MNALQSIERAPRLLDCVAEIVLPSGRFAACRAIVGRDVIESSMHSNDPIRMAASIASDAVTIDGERLDIEKILSMPVTELMPIVEMVANAMQGKFDRKGEHA